MSLDCATALLQLAALGAPSEICNQAPRVGSEMLELDQVLLTSLESGQLWVGAAHFNETGATSSHRVLPEDPIALEYPMIEGEILRRRRPELVCPSDDRSTRHAFLDLLGSGSIIVAPIVIDARVIGFLHAAREAASPPLHDSDAQGLAAFGVCFAFAYERALLRHRIRAQRQEMREVASWADARSGELEDRLVTLAEGLAPHHGTPSPPSAVPAGESALRDLLTRRELDVLRLMVRGETNAGIARDLVVSEGTIKFHVKNILRKLHAANRAEAASRYLRMTLKSTRPEPQSRSIA